MNPKKIDFIICTNDAEQFSEACLYIRNLEKPDGYDVNVLEITEADSIFSGYNAGMNASDAKYKIYMHQDVKIVGKNFLHTMLRVFRDDKVGMMGVVGGTPLTGYSFQWNKGAVIETRVCGSYFQRFSQDSSDAYVKQIDGLLIATQYDLSWRDDFFEGWDIYDRSQCCEFLKAGYKIVVPYQEQPFCLHDCGLVDFSSQKQANKKFIELYGNLFDVTPAPIDLYLG